MGVLSLGVKVGSRIWVGEDAVDVVGIEDGRRIVVRVNGSARYLLDEWGRIEILPGVIAFCGVYGPRRLVGPRSRLAIDAPRSIPIQRDSLVSGSPWPLH